METNRKCANLKNSKMTPAQTKAAYEKELLLAAIKIIGSAKYKGPLIIFDVRDASLCDKEIDRTWRKDIIALLVDYICHFEQMNSLILADDHRDIHFFSNRDICDILRGKFEDLRWPAVLVNAKRLIPMARNFEEAYGMTAASHCADKGYCFTLLQMNSVPISYGKPDGGRVYGIENYLPDILYWVMETVVDKNLYYPPLYNSERPLWNDLSARTVASPGMLKYQQVWHKLLPVD